METDVIIIGGGLAGVTTALALPSTTRVQLLLKTTYQQTNSAWAQGGIVSVIDPVDSIAQHVADTLKAGAYHNTKKTVQFISQHSAAALRWLLQQGVRYDQTVTHALDLTREGGHTHRRIVHQADHTGATTMQHLWQELKRRPNITLVSPVVVVGLLTHNDRVYGVEYVNAKTGYYSTLAANHIVLATGGCGQLFSHTTNPVGAAGEGIALAQLAGAQVKDLEFIQFHPTVLNLPGKPHFLLSEALRGEGALLINQQHKRFMKQYHPAAELAPRDIVARAIYHQFQTGQRVYLDISHQPKVYLQKRFQTIYHTLKKYQLDLTRQPIPVAPAAHYLCGGVVTNLQGQTAVAGLYAVGEVACTGLHGANRLASNSLLECVVMGRQVAHAITTTMHHQPKYPTNPKKAGDIFKKQWDIKKKSQSTLWQHILRDTMWSQVGIVRSQANLTQAHSCIQELQHQLAAVKQKNSLVYKQLELQLVTAQLIIQAALRRKKSLGCHFRTD